MISLSAGARACAKAFALIALTAAAGCRRQPPEPLQLHLELAKTKIQVGEYPWYRFSITNVGRKPIKLDSFLCWQTEDHRDWDKKTGGWFIIQVIDAAGKLIYYNDYRHPHYWTNECGGDTGCSCKTLTVMGSHEIVRFGPEKPLKGGQTFLATPSVVGPVDVPLKRNMTPPPDPRNLPWSAYDLPPAQRQASAARWKLAVESRGYLLGDPTFVSTMTAKDAPYLGYPKAPYPGYRVFDDIGVDKPGRYRMRIIYRPLGSLTTYDELKAMMQRTEATFEETTNLPKETRVFLYTSNWVDFEVEAPPFPEHLFADKKLKTPCDKALNDWMRNALRDAQIWRGDPSGKKLLEHSPNELPADCRPKSRTSAPTARTAE